MARGVNKVILIGNLGVDPETRYTASGSAVSNLRLATTRQWTDRNGQRQEDTEWHRVVFFGKVAEVAGEYLRKGSRIYVEGRLQPQREAPPAQSGGAPSGGSGPMNDDFDDDIPF